MVDVKDSIRIENVVASATLNQRFDLNAIVKGNPGMHACMRLKKLKTATLIFNSGKMV